MSISLNLAASVRVDRDAITGWSNYPIRAGDHGTLTTPVQSLSSKLSGLKKTLFSNDIDICVIDILESGGLFYVLLPQGLSI